MIKKYHHNQNLENIPEKSIQGESQHEITLSSSSDISQPEKEKKCVPLAIKFSDYEKKINLEKVYRSEMMQMITGVQKKNSIYHPEQIVEDLKKKGNIFEILRHPLWDRYQQLDIGPKYDKQEEKKMIPYSYVGSEKEFLIGQKRRELELIRESKRQLSKFFGNKRHYQQHDILAHTPINKSKNHRLSKVLGDLVHGMSTLSQQSSTNNNISQNQQLYQKNTQSLNKQKTQLTLEKEVQSIFNTTQNINQISQSENMLISEFQDEITMESSQYLALPDPKQNQSTQIKLAPNKKKHKHIKSLNYLEISKKDLLKQMREKQSEIQFQQNKTMQHLSKNDKNEYTREERVLEKFDQTLKQWQRQTDILTNKVDRTRLNSPPPMLSGDLYRQKQEEKESRELFKTDHEKYEYDKPKEENKMYIKSDESKYRAVYTEVPEVISQKINMFSSNAYVPINSSKSIEIIRRPQGFKQETIYNSQQQTQNKSTYQNVNDRVQTAESSKSKFSTFSSLCNGAWINNSRQMNSSQLEKRIQQRIANVNEYEINSFVIQGSNISKL